MTDDRVAANGCTSPTPEIRADQPTIWDALAVLTMAGADLVGRPSGMRLQGERRDTRDVRRRHRCAGERQGAVAGADTGRDDRHAWRGQIGLERSVAVSRAARGEGRRCTERRVGDDDVRERRRGGCGERAAIGRRCALHAEKWNRHPGDVAFDRRISRRAVDHRHCARAGRGAEGGASHPVAVPTQRDHQLAGDTRVLARVAAQRDRRIGISQHDDRQRRRVDKRRVVGVLRLDCRAGIQQQALHPERPRSSPRRRR